MPEFQTYTCSQCGDDFAAVAGSNAAKRELCSPRCERLAAGEKVAADD